MQIEIMHPKPTKFNLFSLGNTNLQICSIRRFLNCTYSTYFALLAPHLRSMQSKDGSMLIFLVISSLQQMLQCEFQNGEHGSSQTFISVTVTQNCLLLTNTSFATLQMFFFTTLRFLLSINTS